MLYQTGLNLRLQQQLHDCVEKQGGDDLGKHPASVYDRGL